jgi:hypothetical protein
MENLPEEYKPLSPWTYFLLNIVYAIPLIGFIVLIVMALGGTDNINKRNYARSFFCSLLVSAILIFIFGSSILAIIQSLLEDMNA